MQLKVFSVLFVTNFALGANILGLFDLPSPSHYIWNMAILNALAEKGHNVTILSPDPVKVPHPNIHAFHLEKVYDPLDLLEFSKESTISKIATLSFMADATCIGDATSEGFKALLNYPDDFRFDLVIHDFTWSPFLLGFLHKFNYPSLISVSPFSIPPYYPEYVGGQKAYAIAPYFDLTYTNEMNFVQRFYNTFLYLFEHTLSYIYVIPRVDKFMRESFGSDIPYAGDLTKKTALMLLNSHPAVDYPEPLPPNVILVGGLQIAKPKSLPKELDEFLAKGKKGSVLMSLGTNVKSSALKNETLLAFLETFRQLQDYNILWKFEADTLPAKLSDNVMVNSFLPQNDILAHPNVRAFVSHCGLLSIQEAVWHSVPVVGIPFFMDQNRNCAFLKHIGVATSDNWMSLTTESFTNALQEVLENPQYQENMDRRSKVFRDQPMSPLDTAIWWIEWVLRNPKSDHMRSPATEMNFLQINLLDIIGVVFLSIFGLFYVSKKVLRKLCGRRKSNFVSDKKLN